MLVVIKRLKLFWKKGSVCFCKTQLHGRSLVALCQLCTSASSYRAINFNLLWLQ